MLAKLINGSNNIPIVNENVIIFRCKMKKKREGTTTLSEKISSLIQTQPTFVDSDDDLVTTDQIAVSDDGDELNDDPNAPKFRKLNIELLDAEDSKYSGEKSSRSNLTKAFDNDSSESDESSGGNQSFERSDGEDEEEEDAEVVREEEEEESDEESSTIGQFSENNSGITQLSSAVKTDIEKGKAIKNQLNVWDNLLECRIKFQKCLLAANQLPQHDKFIAMKRHGGTEMQTLLSESCKNVKKLLDTLLHFQDETLKKNSEFTKLQNSNEGNSDEEIISESEVEDEDIDRNDYVQHKGKRNLSDYLNEISSRHLKFKGFRDQTIQKWNDKTRLSLKSSKDFNAFEQSTLKQIEHVLSDKSRLIRRTQLKRSNYHIIGETQEEPPEKALKTEASVPLPTDTVPEIFDDDDFYHQLLRELLDRKSSDVTDPLQLSKQWIQLQKARSKMKRNVDVRASKGRKVRYSVHQKLVNFMMPVDTEIISEVARQELFSSLFGAKK